MPKGSVGGTVDAAGSELPFFRSPLAGGAGLKTGGPLPARHAAERRCAVRSNRDSGLRPPPAGEARSGY